MKRQGYIVLWMVIIVYLTGCGGSRPSNFYILTSTVQQPEELRADSLRIGVGTIRFPEYLNRPQIITHTTDNELNLAEFNRWAEPLQENLSRVLAENLGSLLGTDQVYVLPWQSADQLHYRLNTEIRKFELTDDSEILLIAVWQLLDGTSGQELAHHRSEIHQSTDGPGYDAIARSMSQAVEILSRDISKILSEISNNR